MYMYKKPSVVLSSHDICISNCTERTSGYEQQAWVLPCSVPCCCCWGSGRWPLSWSGPRSLPSTSPSPPSQSPRTCCPNRQSTLHTPGADQFPSLWARVWRPAAAWWGCRTAGPPGWTARAGWCPGSRGAGSRTGRARYALCRRRRSGAPSGTCRAAPGCCSRRTPGAAGGHTHIYQANYLQSHIFWIGNISCYLYGLGSINFWLNYII